jgi:hypothetical protein
MNHESDVGTDDEGKGAHHGHGLMMIACCVPMLVIAIVLVATGVASAGFLFAALACTAMMAFMMRGMSGSDTHEHHG